MTRAMQEIHIDWKGPFSHKEVQSMDGEQDYGLYQFYGYHPVYGADTLLYIGMAYDVTFASRMKQFKFHHHVQWDEYSTSDGMAAYIGRLAGKKKTPDYAEWNREIKNAGELLIYAHTPAWNAEDINLRIVKGWKNKHLFDVHVFNWGVHKRLLPEVSGRRYARNYPPPAEYKIYGEDS